MGKCRLGIIGTGRIAKRFVAECRFVNNVNIEAIYNPHKDSAESFVRLLWQASNDCPLSFTQLGDLWEVVDAVYIASPHETHYYYIIEALMHGKHVLCEKPMCLSAAEAQKAFAIAASRGLILIEALKTAYCPGFRQVLDVLDDGVIGKPHYIEACFTKLESPNNRELTDIQYGGSFTELGSYVLLPMLAIFGNAYTSFDFKSITDQRGLDIFTKTNFSYDNSIATLTCGLGVKSEGRLLIAGENGYIIVPAPWWKTSHFEAHFEEPSEKIDYDCDFEGDGLRYEISYFIDRIFDGYRDQTIENISVTMAGVMSEFLSSRGIDRYEKTQ